MFLQGGIDLLQPSFLSIHAEAAQQQLVGQPFFKPIGKLGLLRIEGSLCLSIAIDLLPCSSKSRASEQQRVLLGRTQPQLVVQVCREVADERVEAVLNRPGFRGGQLV
nr:hypothetical protein Xcnt_16115 [Xanthomonas campestris pv. centellae]